MELNMSTDIRYGLITSAFEAWIEHVVTGRPIVAENLLCIHWNLLNQVFYLWREVNYILHQRQDAEACAVNSRIARDGWDGCLREREVLSLASSDEDREPEEKRRRGYRSEGFAWSS